ncbi:MAG: hypothetical protein NXI00_06240 [Cytophagales bacterium]|nr:hypothetical protein [Cytophagales bacterium]
MKETFLSKMCCPFDHSDLNHSVFIQEGEEIKEGLLGCPECSRVYPIIHGVAIMAPNEYRQLELEKPFYDKWKIELLENKEFSKIELS